MKTVHVPMYRVWDPLNQTEQDAIDRGWEYGAHDVPNAARVFAHYRYATDEMAERTWPLTLRVRDIDKDKVFDVELDRDIRVEFKPLATKEI